jgi:8-oxo-dGTP pyrophosphatase MutT (NUDIX family)
MHPNLPWESHLELRDDPVIEGAWGETPWGFYTYNQPVPAELPIRTSMCVPVCSLDLENPEVMLTINVKRGGYEIPGGHLDPLDNDTLETSGAAAVRETKEETGLHVQPYELVPYGYIEVKNTTNDAYPPLSYMQFFGAHAPEKPGHISDPKVDGAGRFTLDALYRMAERDAMRATELQLVCHGVRAVLRSRGLSDEHIRVP